jgi:hypothetical protein
MNRPISLNIIAGDFNKSAAESKRELSSYHHVCSTGESSKNSYRGNNSLDHIFVKHNKNIHVVNYRSEWNHKLEDMESIRDNYNTFLVTRVPDNEPPNPSDHGLLYLSLHVGNADIGVVSWNVMTQGLCRTEKQKAQAQGLANWNNPNALVHEQSIKVLQLLSSIFSNNEIDIVCLQEYGGVWEEYFNIPRLNHRFRAEGLHFINSERYHPHRPDTRRLPIDNRLQNELMSVPKQGLKRGHKTWVLLNHFNGRAIFVRGSIIDFDKFREIGISRRVDSRKGKQTAYADVYLDKNDTKINLSVGCRHGQIDVDTPVLNMADLRTTNMNKLSRRIRGEGLRKKTTKHKKHPKRKTRANAGFFWKKKTKRQKNVNVNVNVLMECLHWLDVLYEYCKDGNELEYMSDLYDFYNSKYTIYKTLYNKYYNSEYRHYKNKAVSLLMNKDDDIGDVVYFFDKSTYKKAHTIVYKYTTKSKKSKKLSNAAKDEISARDIVYRSINQIFQTLLNHKTQTKPKTQPKRKTHPKLRNERLLKGHLHGGLEDTEKMRLRLKLFRNKEFDYSSLASDPSTHGAKIRGEAQRQEDLKNEKLMKKYKVDTIAEAHAKWKKNLKPHSVKSGWTEELYNHRR